MGMNGLLAKSDLIYGGQGDRDKQETESDH